jgi:hypothetical protein
MATEHDTETRAAALAACGDLFASIAGDAESLRQVICAAANGGRDGALLCHGAQALAERIGLLAQRASDECGRDALIQSADQWSFDPRSVSALQALAGAREAAHG